jgi:flagellar FliJ protein
MAALKSITLAIDLATVKRDQAMAQLKKTLQAQAFAQSQMDQLQQYSQETELRWMQNAQKSTTPELMHHHYQFMERLNQAIAMQDGVLVNTGQRVEAAKQVVLQTEFRLASLKQVLASRQADMAKALERREQKQMDEFAAQQTQRQVRLHAENNV